MNQTKLSPFLDTMESAQIDCMNIDLKGDTITLKLKPCNLNLYDEVEVTFEEVSAFYYLDEHQSPKPTPQQDDSKLSAISYYSEGFGQVAAIEISNGEEVGPVVVSYPNFVITMLDRSLLIEARTIKINGQVFRVGYPCN